MDLSTCTTNIYDWLQHNCLALNPDKSGIRCVWNVIKDIVSLSTYLSNHHRGTIHSFKTHQESQSDLCRETLNVCWGCYFHIRVLHHIQSSMSRETANMVVCMIVNSRMDLTTVILCSRVCPVPTSTNFSGSSANFDQLQQTQNTLAHVVTWTLRGVHITPVLTRLHWLPVWVRLTFKVFTLIYKIHETRQQMYLWELVEVYKPTCTLCFSSANLLAVQTRQFATGARSFRHVAPSVWNSLPDTIPLLNWLRHSVILRNIFLICHIATNRFPVSMSTNSNCDHIWHVKYSTYLHNNVFKLSELLQVPSQ